MCLYPKLIINKKYTGTKKNNFRPPILDDERKKYVAVGCGKCEECRKKKANEWRVRLIEELKTSSGHFVTMTINNENYEKLAESNEFKGKINDDSYEMQNEIATTAVRYFLERLRKRDKKYTKHWFITELGQENTERVHLHGIIFNSKNIEEDMSKWKYGITYVGYSCTAKTVNYIIKYCSKPDEKHIGFKGKILCSKGIGSNYIKYGKEYNKFKGEETKEYYRLENGYKTGLPIYYRNKIYTEEERSELWTNILNKEERWIRGIKISISNGEELYEKALKNARQDSIRLGYNTNKQTKDEENYKKIRAKIRTITKEKMRLKDAGQEQ